MIHNYAITVVGSGLMGHGIAQVFACAGHQVTIVDPNETSLRAAPNRIHQNLEQMVEHGVELRDSVEAILSRVQLKTDMAEGCADANFVVEAVFEDMTLKQQIFAELDRLCPPETVLCSNTSVMSITEIASLAQNKARILGTHWWNPPYLIPLVEIVRTEDVADWAVDAVFLLLEQAGKRPVRVNKDVPGFVGNRLQHALWREAFAIIDDEICDAATVDEVVRNSFGLRLPVLGPMENADMVGLDLTKAIHDYILPHINGSSTPATTLQTRVAQDELGFKSGQGFQAWSDADIETSRRQLTEYLLDVLARQSNAEN